MNHKVQSAIEDLDESLDAFNPSADAKGIRRALRTVLADLNRLREYRRKQLPKDYFSIESASIPGETTAALIMVRGFSEHDLVRAIVPQQQGLFPGETTNPSEHLYPGSNLVWVPLDELPFTLEHTNPKFHHEAAYTKHLSRRPVAGSLAVARDFLVEDTWLGPIGCPVGSARGEA